MLELCVCINVDDLEKGVAFYSQNIQEKEWGRIALMADRWNLTPQPGCDASPEEATEARARSSSWKPLTSRCGSGTRPASTETPTVTCPA